MNIRQINVHFPDNYKDFYAIAFDAETRKYGTVTMYEWSFSDDRHLQSESARTKFLNGSQRELQIVGWKPVETYQLKITFYHDCKFAAVSKLEIFHEPHFRDNSNDLREPVNRWSRKSFK